MIGVNRTPAQVIAAIVLGAIAGALGVTDDPGVAVLPPELVTSLISVLVVLATLWRPKLPESVARD